jgi:CrcB protein
VVALGGALGSVLRYLVALLAKDRGWTAFPWATLAVNVVGCFAITLILTIAAATTMRDQLRLFLTTGVMGGLTTYSTFDFELTKYFVDDQPWRGGAYFAATLLGCFVAGLLGMAAARVVID